MRWRCVRVVVDPGGDLPAYRYTFGHTGHTRTVPSQVRIISRRNSAEWDKLVRAAMRPRWLRTEHDYFGITNEDRAESVRKALRTAGRHQGVGSRVYYQPCDSPGSCRYGGPDCRFHVKYTIFPLDEARAYKANANRPQ